MIVFPSRGIVTLSAFAYALAPLGCGVASRTPNVLAEVSPTAHVTAAAAASDGGIGETTLDAAAIDATGARTCGESERLYDGGSERPSKSSLVAVPGGPGFWCFSWVHQRDFASDCFRSSGECSRERIRAKRGFRDSMPCERQKTAICSAFDDGGGVRCFGDARSCSVFTATRVCRTMSACVEVE